jgi:crossover junction endodeoxyribonuclease RusA
MFDVDIKLPWTTPPLSMNDRKHFMARARLTRQIRDTTHVLVKHLPKSEHITIGLHYRPRDNRRRDVDNLMPVLKACADGVVDAGLVADDTPDLMTKRMPVIHPAVKGEPGEMWLEIRTEDI